MIEKNEFFTNLENFYNFNCKPKSWYCANYCFTTDAFDKKGLPIKKRMFSKNFFFKDFTTFANWSWDNRKQDCYVNYNPLKRPVNRKNENICGANVAAFDIEFADKQKPEPQIRLDLLTNIVLEHIVIPNKINTYMLVISGNGIHLYVPFGAIIKKPLEEMKPAYNKFVKNITILANKRLNQEFGDAIQISADDRKDLAGILRIPGTLNTSSNSLVTIRHINSHSENVFLRKKLFSSLHKTKKAIKAQKNLKIKYDNTNLEKQIPQTIEELYSHPIMKLIFDETLPDVDGWHSTVGFALQALVKFSGISYYDGIKELEEEVNSYWESSLFLNVCNANNVFGPLKAAYNFCIRNKFDKHAESIGKILNIRK